MDRFADDSLLLLSNHALKLATVVMVAAPSLAESAADEGRSSACDWRAKTIMSCPSVQLTYPKTLCAPFQVFGEYLNC
jgi:hypothetical protein